MSDQLIVEREGLEKKEKAELQAIIEALGGTSSARVRKAALIDQILELSGVTAGAKTSDEPETADSSDEGATEPDSPDAVAEPAVEADAPDHPTGPDGEPLADWEVDVLDAGKGPQGRNSGERRQQRSGRGDNDGSRSKGGRGESDKTASGRGDGAKANPGKEKSRNEKANNEKANRENANRDNANKENPNSGRKSSESDEDDSSNKRSRRRNRNRNRDRDDAGNDPVTSEPIEVVGYLDLREEGYAFLRVNGFLPSRDDAYVSVKQVRQFGLRKGDHVVGTSRAANRNEKNPALQNLVSINGVEPEEARARPKFEELTPLFPDERLVMERPHEPLEMTTRIIDLVTPIGKGQRGLIVSPPKAGKTSIMKQIARSIEVNNPEVELIVLLVDERPEEVTDMTRHLERGEVVASTFDRPPEEHTAVAELTLERAKRRVEAGHDVCLIVDGITRLARAYNMAGPGTGRVLSGGVDVAALYPPKRFLGAARNLEEGGSLTILATALVDTGSKMDEVIFEEFKGTGNMELRLDRRSAERRIYPAIDVSSSSTRNEELLRDRHQIEAAWKLRKVVAGLGEEGSGAGTTGAGIEMLVDRLKGFKTNDEFMAEISKSTI